MLGMRLVVKQESVGKHNKLKWTRVINSKVIKLSSRAAKCPALSSFPHWVRSADSLDRLLAVWIGAIVALSDDEHTCSGSIQSFQLRATSGSDIAGQ